MTNAREACEGVAGIVGSANVVVTWKTLPDAIRRAFIALVRSQARFIRARPVGHASSGGYVDLVGHATHPANCSATRLASASDRVRCAGAGICR